MNQSKIMVHLVNNGEAYMLYHITDEDYDDKSGEGIQINHKKAQVIAHYGEYY